MQSNSTLVDDIDHLQHELLQVRNAMFMLVQSPKCLPFELKLTVQFEPVCIDRARFVISAASTAGSGWAQRANCVSARRE